MKIPLSDDTVNSIRARYEHHASTAASAYIVNLCESHALLSIALTECERARDEAQREAKAAREYFHFADSVTEAQIIQHSVVHSQRNSQRIGEAQLKLTRLSEENARLKKLLNECDEIIDDIKIRMGLKDANPDTEAR